MVVAKPPAWMAVALAWPRRRWVVPQVLVDAGFSLVCLSDLGANVWVKLKPVEKNSRLRVEWLSLPLRILGNCNVRASGGC